MSELRLTLSVDTKNQQPGPQVTIMYDEKHCKLQSPNSSESLISKNGAECCFEKQQTNNHTNIGKHICELQEKDADTSTKPQQSKRFVCAVLVNLLLPRSPLRNEQISQGDCSCLHPMDMGGHTQETFI